MEHSDSDDGATNADTAAQQAAEDIARVQSGEDFILVGSLSFYLARYVWHASSCVVRHQSDLPVARRLFTSSYVRNICRCYNAGFILLLD